MLCLLILAVVAAPVMMSSNANFTNHCADKITVIQERRLLGNVHLTTLCTIGANESSAGFIHNNYFFYADGHRNPLAFFYLPNNRIEYGIRATPGFSMDMRLAPSVATSKTVTCKQGTCTGMEGEAPANTNFKITFCP